MDLSTTYLGLKLPHPLMTGAAPFVDNLDLVRRMEDAGAAAITMYSLFEEQILAEMELIARTMDDPANSFAEALTYFPNADQYRSTGPDQYLERLQAVKAAVNVPVIASLNGVSTLGWTAYGKQLEAAGADALELNVYLLSADPEETGAAVDDRVVAIARAVKGAVGIPVAVKLSPFFSSLPNLAARLAGAGADGVVLFNRFYQPDIDVENLEVSRKIRLSDSSELLLRLRWLAMLSGRVELSLGVTGGVHTALDAVKAVMAGASGVQLVSALIRNGPGHLTTLRDELATWLEQHEYESLGQMLGSMSLRKSPNPAAYERANYIKILQGPKSR